MTTPDMRVSLKGEYIAIHTPAGWVVWRTDSPRVQAVRVDPSEVEPWTPLVPAVSPVDTAALRARIASALEELPLEFISPNEFGSLDVDYAAAAEIAVDEIAPLLSASAHREGQAQWALADDGALPLLAGLLADLDRAHTERDKLGREVDRLTAAAHTYRESWMRVGRERDVLWDRATTAERQLERLRAVVASLPAIPGDAGVPSGLVEDIEHELWLARDGGGYEENAVAEALAKKWWGQRGNCIPENGAFSLTVAITTRLIQAGVPLNQDQLNFLPQIVGDKVRSWLSAPATAPECSCGMPTTLYILHRVGEPCREVDETATDPAPAAADLDSLFRAPEHIVTFLDDDEPPAAPQAPAVVASHPLTEHCRLCTWDDKPWDTATERHHMADPGEPQATAEPTGDAHVTLCPKCGTYTVAVPGETCVNDGTVLAPAAREDTAPPDDYFGDDVRPPWSAGTPHLCDTPLCCPEGVLIMASPFEVTHCPWCKRRAIKVNQQTGKRVDHRTKAGRKGAHCLGSGRHRSSLPEVRRG